MSWDAHLRGINVKKMENTKVKRPLKRESKESGTLPSTEGGGLPPRHSPIPQPRTSPSGAAIPARLCHESTLVFIQVMGGHLFIVFEHLFIPPSVDSALKNVSNESKSSIIHDRSSLQNLQREEMHNSSSSSIKTVDDLLS